MTGIPAHPDLAAKVAALRDPRAYPEPVGTVQAIETHMSWVFLTEQHAYKLKKPVRYGRIDFRTLGGRHFYCLEELRLNRRLARSVYLAVVPLCATSEGLRLDGAGPAIDWLVKMVRLPSELMLDSLLKRGVADGGMMADVARMLAAFHRSQPPAPVDGRAYRALLLRRIEEAARELCRPDWHLPADRIRDLAERQRNALRTCRPELDARVAAGRVVEGHGDLRPEHVYLGDPPAVIDCLEFSAELRMVDGADEIAFLALECERAHASGLGAALLHAYGRAADDRPGPALLHLYRSLRAGTRAQLAITHLREARYRSDPKWRMRSLRYLALAARHLAAAEAALRR